MSKHVALAAVALLVATPVFANSPTNLPLGRDPAATPQMDNPPLPWFNYWTDYLGRRTYAQTECLNMTDGAGLADCLARSERFHQRQIAEHAEWEHAAAEREAQRKQADADEAARAKAEAGRVAAEQRAEVARRAEQIRQDRIAAYRAAHDPRPYAERVRSLKGQIALARRVLSREERIGAISGYENRMTKYQAASIMVNAEDQLQAAYRDYRTHGGTLPLSAL